MKTEEAAVGRWAVILKSFGIADTYLVNRHGPCPMCGGADRFRFDDKQGRGTWYCNQCGSGSGMELLKRFTGKEFKELAREVDKMVGTIEPQKQNTAEDDAKARRDRLVKIQKASRVCRPCDDVSLYLANRFLSVPAIGVRIHPSMPYWAEGAISAHYPAMLCTFSSREGKPITYHVTYLSAGQKAPVVPSRKILPPTEKMQGGAIRLSPVARHIGIAEGVETALAASEMYGIPVWAATSASMLEAFQPPEGVEELTIFGDNDASYTGQAAAYSLARRLSGRGMPVRVFVAMVAGTDFADAWKLIRDTDIACGVTP